MRAIAKRFDTLLLLQTYKKKIITLTSTVNFGNPRGYDFLT